MNFIPMWALEFAKKYWLHMVIALAAVAYTVAIYRAGGAAPRAELKTFKVQTKAATDQLLAEQHEQEEESDAYIAKIETDHEARVDQVNRAWDAYIAGLPGGGDPDAGVRGNTGGGPVRESVRIVAGVCDDAAANNRLSDALSLYRDEVRGIHGLERAEAAALLRTCQVQTEALIKAQAWGIEERRIHEHAAPLIHLQ